MTLAVRNVDGGGNSQSTVVVATKVVGQGPVHAMVLEGRMYAQS